MRTTSSIAGVLCLVLCASFVPFRPAAAKPGADAELLARLSSVERDQLGKFKQLQDGSASEYSYPTGREWPALRGWLVSRSLKSNRALDPDLTAYTPGETLWLMREAAIRQWHRRLRRYHIPDRYERVIFVPCAKTKPWDETNAQRSGLYRAYHEVLKESASSKKPIYFVTISEPLGIVPQEFWADFPQYDNPGLFRDDAQRSGAFTRDWKDSPFGRKMIVPFDPAAYSTAIGILGDVLADFIQANQSAKRKFYSFVDEENRSGTHSEMLTHALATLGTPDLVSRFLKRPGPRQSPTAYILKSIQSLQSR